MQGGKRSIVGFGGGYNCILIKGGHMINLYRLFLLEKALDYGEKEAIRYRGQSFSYREVDERIRQISAFLRNNHISKNRYVIV